jgi:phosphatidylinositol alpha-1,6-mannosyltransferase
MSEAGRILLITNNFPPMVGGSASVYNNLALCEPDHISVLAPSRNYFTGEDFTDWRQHDRNVPYKVIRLPLLRTLLNRRSDGFTTRWLFRAEDLALRFRIFARVGREVWFGNVRTICLGELLASAWMLRVFRLAFGVRTIVYIHGEEITREDDYDVGHQRARRALHTADAIVVVSRGQIGPEFHGFAALHKKAGGGTGVAECFFAPFAFAIFRGMVVFHGVVVFIEAAHGESARQGDFKFRGMSDYRGQQF